LKKELQKSFNYLKKEQQKSFNYLKKEQQKSLFNWNKNNKCKKVLIIFIRFG
jgi:hypothetical protein